MIGLEAVVFVAIGTVEYATRSLFWNDQVIRSNEFHTYFRVNSVFWDPNVYGRWLALAIVVAMAALLWARERRDQALLTALVAVLWIGLAPTFSQSSFIALLVGLAVLAALRWSLRWTLAAVGAGAVAAVLVVLLAGGSSVSLSRINIDTSGRANLVSGGIHLFAQRPVYGYGVGLLPARLPRTRRHRRRCRSRSPTPSRSRSPPSRGSSGSRHTSPCWSRRYGRWEAAACVARPGLREPVRPAQRDRREGRRPRGVRRPAGAHDGVRRVLRGPDHLGCCWRPGLSLAAGPGPRRPIGFSRVRIPAPPGDDRRRLHRGERRLEADRGRAAAALHALPDPGRLRRRRGDVRRGRRRQHRRPLRHDRGAAALLLQGRRGPGAGRRHLLRGALLALHGGGADRPALRRADLRSAARRPGRRTQRPGGRRTRADRDRRPLGADDDGVPAHPVPARGARPRLLRDDDPQRAGGDRADRRARRRRGRGRPRAADRQLRERRRLRPRPDRRPAPPPLALDRPRTCCGG